jgi:hypoxanthine phosphoribosyltransferase
LLQISLHGYESVEAIQNEIQRRNAKYFRRKCKSFEDRFQSIKDYFSVCQLTPVQILNRDRSVALVDVVDSGTTMGTLVELLAMCCEAEKDWKAARKRLHFVAVQRDPTNATEPFWQPEHSSWTSQFDAAQFNQVVMDADLWSYLAAEQFKTIYSYPPWRWGENTKPPAEAWDIYAARGARELYRRGERTRPRLASLLDEPPEPSDAIKKLARELRREAGRW